MKGSIVAKAIVLFCWVLACLHPASAATAPAPALRRIEVPVRLVLLPDAIPRYAVSLTIGGQKIDALLDTGSRALLVLARDLPPRLDTVAAPLQRLGYGAGDVLTGPVIGMRVYLGDDTVGALTAVQVISSIGCSDDQPNCAANLRYPEQYEIGGDRIEGAGFDAIMGVEMPQPGGKLGGATNVLARLGRSWILTVPLDDSQPGSLIINPTPAEKQKFTYFPFDPRLRDRVGLLMSNSVTACLTIEGYAPFCGLTSLDSGGPAFTVYSPTVTTAGTFPTDTPASLVFRNPQGATETLNFVVQADQPEHVMVRPVPAGQLPHIEAGILTYQSFAVLYDMDRNAMGLAPR
jgi:hypothetical protein